MIWRWKYYGMLWHGVCLCVVEREWFLICWQDVVEVKAVGRSSTTWSALYWCSRAREAFSLSLFLAVAPPAQRLCSLGYCAALLAASYRLNETKAYMASALPGTRRRRELSSWGCNVVVVSADIGVRQEVACKSSGQVGLPIWWTTIFPDDEFAAIALCAITSIMGKQNSKLKKDALDKLAAETYCKLLF